MIYRVFELIIVFVILTIISNYLKPCHISIFREYVGVNGKLDQLIFEVCLDNFHGQQYLAKMILQIQLFAKNVTTDKKFKA